MPLDDELLERGRRLPVQGEIVKAAGNMVYPMGLRGERLAGEILTLAQLYGLPFEAVAGCPNLKLNENIIATLDISDLKKCSIVVLAIPSSVFRTTLKKRGFLAR